MARAQVARMIAGPRLAHGTVCVPSLSAARALYVDLFEQRVVDEACISATEAQAWQAPTMAGAASLVLQPPSGAPVLLRLIECAVSPRYRAGRHYGWTALELSVESADAMHARLLAAGIPIIAPPKPLAFTDKLYPMQARGPGGEALYLNEVRGNLPGSDLPMARSWVDALFIAVLGSHDRQRSITHYNDLLGTTLGGTWNLEYNVINRSFDLPADTKHTLSTVVDGRTVLFEVDQYPSTASAAAALPGCLPAGVAMIGVRVARLPARAAYISPPARRAHAPYFGAQVGVLRGPDGEWVELIEGSA